MIRNSVLRKNNVSLPFLPQIFNFRLFSKKQERLPCVLEKTRVSCLYSPLWEKQKYQIAELMRRAKLSRSFNILNLKGTKIIVNHRSRTVHNFWTLTENTTLKRTLVSGKALAEYQSRYKPGVNRTRVSTHGTTAPELSEIVSIVNLPCHYPKLGC